MKNGYRNHVKTFLLFLGDAEPTYRALRKYREFLIKAYNKSGTMQVKYSAAVDYAIPFLPDSGIELEKNLFTVRREVPFMIRNTSSVYHVTEAEYLRLISEDEKSVKRPFWIEVIRRLDLKIGELCSIELYDPRVSEEDRGKAINIFGSKRWLCETSNGKQYHPTYIGHEITKIGWKIIGKHISPESIRYVSA